MRVKSEYIVLALLFAAICGIRLYFAFQSDNYAPEAYYTIRQVEHILETGFPLFNDELSYGGRSLFQGFLYFYILAAFRTVLPEAIVYKVIPNIFATSIIIVMYAITLYLTRHKSIALFSAYVAGFIPIFFFKTVNDISVYAIVIPIILLFIYCMLRLHEHRSYVIIIIVLILLLRLIHPSVTLLIMSLLTYLILLRLEGLPQLKEEIEIILFSTFLIVWSIFITFKRPFLAHGIDVIWQNIPAEILNNYFKDLSIIESVYAIGLIPLILGMYTIYLYLFKEKDRSLYLIISFAITISILLWFKFVSLVVGMLFLSPILVILFSVSYKRLLEYFEKTRFAGHNQLFIFAFVLAFFIFSIIPAFVSASKAMQNNVSDEEIQALAWLQEHSDPKAMVLGNLEEGHVITAVSRRANVIDTNFLLIKDAEYRLKDIRFFFTTPSETEAIRILNAYNVDYIFFSQKTKAQYGIQSLEFTRDKLCFNEVYNRHGIQIYRALCRLEVT
ncbi:hypothetical protein HYV81_03720 [Candidatus Woesearchaeota archaeon]|nr:hypothetical protein [Candidatus Woesearchaeota archaeon]